jgi:rSAM/selenodomain-associated transferase 2
MITPQLGTLQEQKSLSIIIPALNEATSLGSTLAALSRAPIIREIVVVDGGSSDDTIAAADAVGARVIAAARGRGSQLAAGAAAATGDWLLFLHADCRPETGWDAAVAAFIAGPESTGRAAYFDFALDDPDPRARRLERFVAWRCRIFALPYGDQGLLIARSLYDAIGGFAPLPLMEDVDLVRRLGRRRLGRIAVRAIASARRYRRDGYWRRPLRNLACLALHFAGVPPERVRRFYG